MNFIEHCRNSRQPLRLSVIFVAFFLTPMLSGCGDPQSSTAPDSDTHWVGTWATAPQLVEPHNLPPEPGLAGNTLRQVVRVSLGGSRLRARFSNEFGISPVTLNAVHLAASTGASAIDPETDRALTFDGEPRVTIEAGHAVVSDPFPFDLKPRSDVAFTIHFGETSPDVTGHPGSRTTSYLQSGNTVSAVALPDAARTDHWYIIAGIDVVTPPEAAAVVVLGDSITDGRGSGTNEQNRWPDELARRLHENPGTGHVAVLNQGIGGNCVLRECLGPAGLIRFERDVLGQSGVRWLIVLEGINDIEFIKISGGLSLGGFFPASAIPGPDTGVLFLEEGDKLYDAFRQGFNKRIQRRPKVIAVCHNEVGVQKAVQYSRKHSLPIAVKSGGHSFEGFSLNNDGLVIDVSQMNHMDLDAGGRLIAQPSVKLVQLYTKLLPQGRLLPTGSCATVGLSGITLGGGYGLFSRQFGLTCDYLTGVRMVTATGEVIDSDNTPDLLWGCRGGGNGNFGVVTQLRYDTVKAPGTLYQHRFRSFKLSPDKAVEAETGSGKPLHLRPGNSIWREISVTFSDGRNRNTAPRAT